MSSLWRESFDIHFYEVEPNGQASIAALCRFMQAAADSQCRPLNLSVTSLLETGRTWILSRFALRIHSLPRLYDTVVVETWPTNLSRGIRAYRDFQLLDANREVLAQASSVWFLLDTRAHRPIRLPDSVLALCDRQPLYQDPVDATELTPPEQASTKEQQCVRWRDVDANGHANNVSYLEWVLDSVPLDVRRDGVLSHLDILFQREALVEERVISVAEAMGQTETPSFRHQLETADGKRLAIARTDWLYLDDAEAEAERFDAA